MQRRSLSLVTLLLVLCAVPMSASQFVDVSFDQVARESSLIVRGTVVNTYSAWDDAHELIFTYATVRVHRYFGEATGPDTLVVREVGGTVDGYTQEAIGFPAIRNGENVVLMLARWDDGTDYRIHAFNKGKYLVRTRDGMERLVEDPVKQGEERLDRDRETRSHLTDDASGLSIQEFAQMVDDARAGSNVDRRVRNQ
jgi:hypothetical protein